MKKIFVPVVIAVISVFYSCGPAAENRVYMDYVAKRTADSIARGLDSCLNDPLRENVFKNAPPVVPVPAATATSAPTGK